MEHVSLYDLINCLEYGTDLHISIVFLNDFGNYKTNLPSENASHSKPYCQHMKSTTQGFQKCFRCRNTALKLAITRKKAFGGLCSNGIYEYCHPVIDSNSVVAVIFIGNILQSRECPHTDDISAYEDTFEKDFPLEKCKIIASITENHIKMLIHEYLGENKEYDPLIKNIRDYIEEFFSNDISVSQIASAFNYSEKYIGRLFKKQTKMTISEYVNRKKLQKAIHLLTVSNIPIIEIASMSGFNNVTYFNKLFKTEFGLTPSKYRLSKR